MNLPLSSAQHPHVHDEYPPAWIFEKNPIAEAEARGYTNVFTPLTRSDLVLEQWRRKGLHGITLSEMPGIFGERHELALAANSGTTVDGALLVLLDIGSNINII
eukprot:6797764-Pyramimonas_sp.AAC.1